MLVLKYAYIVKEDKNIMIITCILGFFPPSPYIFQGFLTKYVCIY